MSTIKHESITHIPIACCSPQYRKNWNNISSSSSYGSFSTYWEKTHCWGLKGQQVELCQTSDKYFQMIHAIGHLINRCVLSSNRMVQKKHMLDPSPHLFEAKLNGSPPIMPLHMNTFAWSGKWECQSRCNNCHHLTYIPHIFCFRR